MWEPRKYLHYADLRARPFFDLVSRIEADRPRIVMDLGCGPGHLTRVLADRWPDARVDALDSSPEMVARARAVGFDAQRGDVAEWRPRPNTDVVVCNAVLQWVPGHADLIRRWVHELPSGAWLAVQVPRNFDAPSHRLTRELAASPAWADRLADVSLSDRHVVSDPVGYAELLADEGCAVDAWETTYLQRLTGKNPVLEWITGTALLPIKAELGEDDWQEFRAQLEALLAEAYPARPDGTTWFPFRRVFFVARTP